MAGRKWMVNEKPAEMDQKLEKQANHHELLDPQETLSSPMSVFSPESDLRESISDEEKNTKNKSNPEETLQDSTNKIFFKDACRVYEIDKKIDTKNDEKLDEKLDKKLDEKVTKEHHNEDSTHQPNTSPNKWILAFEGVVTVTETEMTFTKYSLSTDSEGKYTACSSQTEDNVIKIHDILRLRESKLQDRKVNLKVSKVSLEKNQNQEQFALKNHDNANWYYIFFRDSLWRTNFCEKVSKLYVLDGKMKNYHEARELMKIEREEREAEKLANMELLVHVDVDSDLGCSEGVNQAQLLARHEGLREAVRSRESVESVDSSKLIESSKSVEPVSVEPVSVEPVSVEPVSVEPVSVKSVSVEPVSIEPAIFEPDLSTTPIYMPTRRKSKLSTPQKRKNLEPENKEKRQKPELTLDIPESNFEGSQIEISIPNVETYTDPKSPTIDVSNIDVSDPNLKYANISLPSLPQKFDESLETHLPSSPCVLPSEEIETTNESPAIKAQKLQTKKKPEPDTVNIPETSVSSLKKSPNNKNHAAKPPIVRNTSIKKLFSQRSGGKFTELDLLKSFKNSGFRTEIRVNEAFSVLSKLPNIPREPVIWGLLKKLNDRGQIIMEMPKKRTRTSRNTILLLE